MSKTKIPWTDETWPVVTGCTPCSIGCTNCYAARMAATRLKHHPRYEGLATISDGKARWTGEVRLNHDVLEQPLRWRRPRRIFVASMGDLFHKDVPLEYIARVWQIMRSTSWHTYQVLTKQPGRMLQFLRQCDEWEGWITNDGMPPKSYGGGPTGIIVGDTDHWPLPNIWLSVSVENQAAADERREYLRQCPAAIKFVSYEPALGPVDWTGWEFVSQIISGGESGPGARPSHPDWHRATRDFCQANGIAYFFKQWGAWGRRKEAGITLNDGPFGLWDNGTPGYNEWVAGGFSSHGEHMVRVGKKRAGHLLDGREWQQFPVADGAGNR